MDSNPSSFISWNVKFNLWRQAEVMQQAGEKQKELRPGQKLDTL